MFNHKAHGTSGARLFALLAILLLAGSAHAATIVVKKGGPHPTIQSGVNLAGPNDTVLVKKGLYQENVSIPAGKNGLTLKAAGKVTIDARPAGGAGAGPGILVDSSEVTIHGFTIKNALNNGGLGGYGVHGKQDQLAVKGCDFTANETADVYVETANSAVIADCASWGTFGRCVLATGDVTLVSKLTVKHCAGDAIRITGNSARVAKCSFDYVNGHAVEIIGADCLIEDCKALHNGNWCYCVNGNNAVVRNNVLRYGDNWGVYIEGDDAQVLDNDIAYNSNWGIYMSGNGTLVRNNKLRSIANYGIYMSGNSNAVEENSLLDIANYGINIDGDGNTVEDNRIRRVSNEAIRYEGLLPRIIGNVCEEVFGNSEGIRVDGVAVVNGVVRSNRVKGSGSHGIQVTSNCTNFSIKLNIVEDCGGQSRDGFHIEGNGHDLAKNVAKGCSGDGFYLSGNSMDVIDNEAKGNGRDGFDEQSGNGNSLTNNTATDNAAEGIENNGTNAVINDNTAKKNRIDFAKSGTIASFIGNVSSDGTHITPLAPELD